MKDRLGFVGKFMEFCWIFREFFTIVGMAVDQSFLVLSKQWKSKLNKGQKKRQKSNIKVLNKETFFFFS